MHKYTKITITQSSRSAGLPIIAESWNLCPVVTEMKPAWLALEMTECSPFSSFNLGEHVVLGLCHALSASLVPLPLLDFPSASVSSHKQALFLDGCLDHTAVVHSCFLRVTLVHSALTRSLSLSISFLFSTSSCDSSLWKAAERAGGRNRRGWWEIERPKVSQTIFAGGLIV